MLKNISNLGATLSKKEQQGISGGFNNGGYCWRDSDCYCEYIGPGDTYCGSNNHCQYW